MGSFDQGTGHVSKHCTAEWLHLDCTDISVEGSLTAYFKKFDGIFYLTPLCTEMMDSAPPWPEKATAPPNSGAETDCRVQALYQLPSVTPQGAEHEAGQSTSMASVAREAHSVKDYSLRYLQRIRERVAAWKNPGRLRPWRFGEKKGHPLESSAHCEFPGLVQDRQFPACSS